MNEIGIGDAKRTLSAVIDDARRGQVLSFEEWEILSRVREPEALRETDFR